MYSLSAAHDCDTTKDNTGYFWVTTRIEQEIASGGNVKQLDENTTDVISIDSEGVNKRFIKSATHI